MVVCVGGEIANGRLFIAVAFRLSGRAEAYNFIFCFYFCLLVTLSAMLLFILGTVQKIELKLASMHQSME